MKMIISIVSDEDSENVSHSLTNAGYRVTTIASTGGFLRRGVTTLMCGLEDESLSNAIAIIKGCFPPPAADKPKRCTLFVLNITDYHHF